MFRNDEQTMLMGKSNEKKRNSFDTRVVSLLAIKHNFSTRYIKQILTGDRTPVFSDFIIKEYKQLYKAIENEINKKLNGNE